jgi:hypothetical protein
MTEAKGHVQSARHYLQIADPGTQCFFACRVLVLFSKNKRAGAKVSGRAYHKKLKSRCFSSHSHVWDRKTTYSSSLQGVDKLSQALRFK